MSGVMRPAISMRCGCRAGSGRAHYAPIEAAALARYRFFERLGFFGIELGTVRGGVVFMRTSLAILAKK
jgi:hypothetical protein